MIHLFQKNKASITLKPKQRYDVVRILASAEGLGCSLSYQPAGIEPGEIRDIWKSYSKTAKKFGFTVLVDDDRLTFEEISA